MISKKIITESVILNNIRRASEGSPVTAKELKKAATGKNGHDTADVRRVIRRLVAQGHPIASNGKGYFYLQSAKQCQRYLNRLLVQQIRVSNRISNTYHAFFKD